MYSKLHLHNHLNNEFLWKLYSWYKLLIRLINRFFGLLVVIFQKNNFLIGSILRENLWIRCCNLLFLRKKVQWVNVRWGTYWKENEHCLLRNHRFCTFSCQWNCKHCRKLCFCAVDITHDSDVWSKDWNDFFVFVTEFVNIEWFWFVDKLNNPNDSVTDRSNWNWKKGFHFWERQCLWIEIRWRVHINEAGNVLWTRYIKIHIVFWRLFLSTVIWNIVSDDTFTSGYDFLSERANDAALTVCFCLLDVTFVEAFQYARFVHELCDSNNFVCLMWNRNSEKRFSVITRFLFSY